MKKSTKTELKKFLTEQLKTEMKKPDLRQLLQKITRGPSDSALFDYRTVKALTSKFPGNPMAADIAQQIINDNGGAKAIKRAAEFEKREEAKHYESKDASLDDALLGDSYTDDDDFLFGFTMGFLDPQDADDFATVSAITGHTDEAFGAMVGHDAAGLFGKSSPKADGGGGHSSPKHDGGGHSSPKHDGGGHSSPGGGNSSP